MCKKLYNIKGDDIDPIGNIDVVDTLIGGHGVNVPYGNPSVYDVVHVIFSPSLQYNVLYLHE